MSIERKKLEVRTKARNVVLTLGTGISGDSDKVDASLMCKKHDHRFIPLAFACAPFAHCRIYKAGIGDVSVWVGSAAFDITEDQALLVHKTLGIPVDTNGAPL